jgi:uncharacterized RDD family membrane protein YckC
MMDETPATPSQTENVTGRRIVAGFIDVIVLGILFVVMSALFGDAESSSNGDSGNFSVSLSGVPFIIYVLLSIAYYLVPEAMTGQSLGKKIMGLRVVALEDTLSWGKAAIRTVLRIIDSLPVLYLVGLISVAVTKKNQRIGDLAAGTIVVRA